MRIEFVTIFPRMFALLAQDGVVARAHAAGAWRYGTHDPREFTTDGYRRVDDRAYGGGPGMVMLAEPLARAVAAARSQAPDAPVLCVSARGRPVRHADIVRWATLPALVIVCGRYEGVDERVIEALVDEEVAVGDFVVSGGELPAMMLADAIVRLLPGTLADPRSAEQDSFAQGLLDCPHYTRPEVWTDPSGRERPVPPVLLSGHHAQIERWRREQALRVTARLRPDLIAAARAAGALTAQDEKLLATVDRLQ